MIDTTLLGQLSAEMMEALGDEYDETDDATVRTALVVVEVDSPTDSQFRFKCSDDRVWLLEKLLEELLDVVDVRRRGFTRTEDD